MALEEKHIIQIILRLLKLNGAARNITVNSIGLEVIMGQVGANLGNSNVTNPQEAKWGDLDASEKGARLIAGGTRGLAQGFNNYNQQQLQPGIAGLIQSSQINPMMSQQPKVDLPGMYPQGTQMGPPPWGQETMRNKNPFFFGYGGL